MRSERRKKNELRIPNLSAYWLPKLTLSRQFGGTVYTISGTYEGHELLNGKLRRILGRSLEEQHP